MWRPTVAAALAGGAGGQARDRGTPRGDSEAEVPTTGICDTDSCEEIPEVFWNGVMSRSNSELRACGADVHHDGKGCG